jgi:hypothetical protein
VISDAREHQFERLRPRPRAPRIPAPTRADEVFGRGKVTIDIDATDIEVYGPRKAGVAYNYYGQRCGRALCTMLGNRADPALDRRETPRAADHRGLHQGRDHHQRVTTPPPITRIGDLRHTSAKSTAQDRTPASSPATA